MVDNLIASMILDAEAHIAAREDIPAAHQTPNATAAIGWLRNSQLSGHPLAVASAAALVVATVDRERAAWIDHCHREARRRAAADAGRARASILDYDPAAVRAWARTVGRECPPVGRFLPSSLVRDYLAAGGGHAGVE